MERNRDPVDELLDDILGVGDPDYADISIVELFEGDVEALDAIEQTLPVIQGKRVRAEQ